MSAKQPQTNGAIANTEIDPTENLYLQSFENRTAMVGVIGLGYVGLPFAVEKAKAGFHVIGVEQNPVRCQAVNDGKNYISDVVDAELREVVAQGLVEAVGDYSRVPEMDVVVIAVPTPLTKNLTPDLQFVENVAENLALHIRPGQLIALESTTYPGTTQDVLRTILEKSGLKAEKDFFLAYSPERVDPGNKQFTTKNTTKVVGAVGPRSLEVAGAFYRSTFDHIVEVSSTEAAELSKVFENTFRAVNIALVNELAMLCDRMGLNVWEVLDAAFTKPFGIMPFYPGPGVGGHCIPLDPHYLEWKAKEYDFNTHFIALAGEINRHMPYFVREKAARILNDAAVPLSRATVLILGMSYKKDVGDWRESPSVHVLRHLRASGANVVYHDPHVPTVEIDGQTSTSMPLDASALRDADLVIIATDHTAFNHDLILEHSTLILDTRNALKAAKKDRDKVTLL